MSRPQVLQQARTVTVRLSSADYRRLVRLADRCHAEDPGFTKSDALRQVIRSAGRVEEEQVRLQARIQELERRDRDLRRRAEVAEAQAAVLRRRVEAPSRQQRDLERQLRSVLHLETEVEERSRRGGQSRWPALNVLRRRLGDWGKLHAALVALRASGEPGRSQ